MLTVNTVKNGIANVSDESETFDIRAEALDEYSEDMDYDEYQDWVAGAIIR